MLWVFLSHFINTDHSCRSAVARLISHRVAAGQSACSARTGAYCQARARLPERFFARLVQLVGRALESNIKDRWLWKGRQVYMFDGSIITDDSGPSRRFEDSTGYLLLSFGPVMHDEVVVKDGEAVDIGAELATSSVSRVCVRSFG